MSNDLLIAKKEIGDYRINIFYDTNAGCPVTDWDMGACYIFESLSHGHYELYPDCDWNEWASNIREESLESILQRIAADVVTQEDIIKYYKAGKVENVRFRYDRHERQWKLEYLPTWKGANADWQSALDVEPYELKAYDYRRELLEQMDMDDCISSYCKVTIKLSSYSYTKFGNKTQKQIKTTSMSYTSAYMFIHAFVRESTNHKSKLLIILLFNSQL